MSNSEIFRNKGSIFGAAIIYLMVLVMIIQTIFTGNTKSTLLTIGIGALAALKFYLILQRPLLEISDEGIKIVNPLWTYTIGWRDIIAIETKFTMSVQVGTQVIYAWAAPAPGRYHSRKVHLSELRGMDIANQSSIRFGESPRSDSGVAAYIARSRWKKFPEGYLEFGKVLNVHAIYLGVIATIITLAGLIIH